MQHSMSNMDLSLKNKNTRKLEIKQIMRFEATYRYIESFYCLPSLDKLVSMHPLLQLHLYTC